MSVSQNRGQLFGVGLKGNQQDSDFFIFWGGTPFSEAYRLSIFRILPESRRSGILDIDRRLWR